MVSPTQRFILTQILSAASVALLVAFLARRRGSLLFGAELPPDASAGDRLAFAFRCLVFSILPMLVAMQGIGGRRYESTKLSTDPTAPVPASDKGFHIAQRVLQNTLEQTTLHVIVVLALASTLAVDQFYLIQLLVLFFVTGRAAFQIGYHYQPIYRAFGFALTFLPTVVLLLYAIYLVIMGRRGAFPIGYHYNPIYRSFGYTFPFLPSYGTFIVLLFYAIYVIIMGRSKLDLSLRF